MPLDAHYFDGHSSRRHSVSLAAGEGCLLLDSPDGMRIIPVADIRVSEPQGNAPRTLRFAGGDAFCEAGQGPEFDALLAALGYRNPVAVRLQGRWRWALICLGAIFLTLVACYFWGLPWGAKVIAPHVPISAMHSISEAALAQLDGSLLKPSTLPEERRRKLSEGFQTLAAADPDLAPFGDRLALNFRAAPRIGPNAFAFPGGQIVLFDELVRLHDDDEEIFAILAHELGHLSKRHGARRLIQSSVIAAAAAAWLGDISYAAVAISTAMLNSGYSRDMEREADDYAAILLRRQGKSPVLLANALERLDRFYQAKRRGTETTDNAGEKNGAGNTAGGEEKENEDGIEKYLDWLSSHPGTGERIRRLRENPESADR
ncbi:MAG: M48 family metallopeptidase [Azoarcus sp.]|jgi:Zn-dependent protease with chaperone function|nr:M48 family metallopeptidase [Azoarcus sp.]